jgi:thiamine-monophosphate kinase
MNAAESRLVRDVGEFGLINVLADTLPSEARAVPDLSLGIGDDAAVWQPAAGEQVVVTTDSLIEGVHFRLDWTDWRSLGHKSLAVNISDLAAMGAAPKLAMVTLGLRGDERLADLRAMYEGLGDLARRYGVAIAGGDIVRSPQSLMLHVTALGETRHGRVLTRSGARAGDLIAVSGTIGASAAGLRLLQSEEADQRRQAATAPLLIAAHLRPEPRVALGEALLRHGASATMDLSDGLLGDLPKILEASGVSGRVDARRIPVAAAVRALFPDDWLELAMRGGEDYELLFTAPPEQWPEIERAVAAVGGAVTAIGEVVARAGERPALEVIDFNGRVKVAKPGAYDHFGGQ